MMPLNSTSAAFKQRYSSLLKTLKLQGLCCRSLASLRLVRGTNLSACCTRYKRKCCRIPYRLHGQIDIQPGPIEVIGAGPLHF